MHKKKSSWWQCYLICFVMVSLLALDYIWPHPWTEASAVLIIVCGYIGIAWWVRVNRGALADDDQKKEVSSRESASSEPVRDIPLSPVQAHYLSSIARYKSD